MIYDNKKSSKKRYKQTLKAEPLSSKDSLFSYVNGKVEESISNTSVWLDKQSKYHRLRMRIKKTKTFPFVGCSNIRMPTAEIKIRKVKAGIVNAIFGIRPIVQVVPPPSGTWETARKIEKWLDHLIMDVMQYLNKGIMTVDQMLECGFFINKPYWRLEINKRQETFDLDDISLEEANFLYDTNTSDDMIKQFLVEKFDVDLNDWVAKENEEILDTVVKKIAEANHDFDFFVQDVLYNAPDVALVPPERLFVPADSGIDPQKCGCLVHEFYLPIQELETNAKHKGWDIDGVTEIKDYRGIDTRTLKDDQKDLREGVSRLNETGLVRIWEYFGWYDLNEDGEKEKVVLTQAPDFSKTLHKRGLPNLNGKFPFVKFFYELTDDRWYSHRGIPEMVEDIIKEIDTQHNMKIDSQTVRNAPMFVYRAGMVNPNLVQMIPNQGIPVNGLQPLTDTIQVLNAHNSNVEFSYEREQQILEAQIEECIGQTNFTLQSMINRRQPRTLGEVELQNQNVQQIFSLDVTMQVGQFTELFNMIYDLWSQHGDDEVEFAYFGQEGWEKIKLTKEEIQGKYKITVRGNDQNTNPQVKLQKAQQILLGVTNELAINMGVVTPVELANGLKRFYQDMDIPNWEELINQKIQPPPPPPVATIIKPNFDELTDGEQAQVISSVGIKPDMPGRALRKQQELMELNADVAVKTMKKEGKNEGKSN